MDVSIIGTGYVGLVTGVCLASLGINVLCCDRDEDKIKALKNGILPIYEPYLGKLMENCLRKNERLDFTSDTKQAVSHSNIIFIAVNTPTVDNKCDVENVFDVAKTIGIEMEGYKLVVNKSTVPVGTVRQMKELIRSLLYQRGKNDLEFDVVSNPEFLREGSAVDDFINPDRIIIGADSERAVDLLKQVYASQISLGVPVLVTGPESAELAKYASNAFLATKISFINEIANLCEQCNANVLDVALGMGMDKRIGDKFLRPGPGFGGSCFPKDTGALVGMAEKLGTELSIVRAVIESNKKHKEKMVSKICKAAEIKEKSTVTVLGLSFKPDTDDIRESPAIAIISGLLGKKAGVKAYDPMAMDNFRKFLPHLDVTYCTDVLSACTRSHCIVLVTEWEQFSKLDFKQLKKVVEKPVFVDLRNVYDPAYVRSMGFKYEGVGVK